MEAVRLSKMERDYLEALVEDDMFLCVSFPGPDRPEFPRVQNALVSLVKKGLAVVFGDPEPPVPLTVGEHEEITRAMREGRSHTEAVARMNPVPGEVIDLAPDEAEAVLRCADNWTNPRAPFWMVRSTAKGDVLLAAEKRLRRI